VLPLPSGQSRVAAAPGGSASSPAPANRPMWSLPRSPVNWQASSGPSPGACRQQRANRSKRVSVSKGGASESPDTLLLGKAGGAVAVRRTLASTICRVVDPTQVPRPRQLRDASTVMRFRPAHQRMINRRHDDRASCPARQSLEQTLERKPRTDAPATCKGGQNATDGTPRSQSSAGLSEPATAPNVRFLPLAATSWEASA
jgi:hypothetical protein